MLKCKRELGVDICENANKLKKNIKHNKTKLIKLRFILKFLLKVSFFRQKNLCKPKSKQIDWLCFTVMI